MSLEGSSQPNEDSHLVLPSGTSGDEAVEADSPTEVDIRGSGGREDPVSMEGQKTSVCDVAGDGVCVCVHVCSDSWTSRDASEKHPVTGNPLSWNPGKF